MSSHVRNSPLDDPTIRKRISLFLSLRDALSCCQVSKLWSMDFSYRLWHTVDLLFHKSFVNLDNETIAKYGHHIRVVRWLLEQQQLDVLLCPSVCALSKLQIVLDPKYLSQMKCYDLIRQNHSSLHELDLNQTQLTSQYDLILSDQSFLPSSNSGSFSKLSTLIIPYLQFKREVFSAMLKGCPSLLYLDMKGTVLISSHDIELYRHPGVRHLESLLCSTVSPDPAKPYSQSLLIHFPNLEIWHFGGGKGLEIPFDKLKDGLANRCPKLRAVVTLLTPGAIVQYLLIHVFKRLTDIFLRYQELTPELIHAVLLHQRTLKAFRVMKYFNLLHEENDHVRENGWILQAILCHCLNLEVFDFEMYEMDMDDVERTEWKCRNLRELHVRIRGIDTREKVYAVIARLKEGRIAKTKASAFSSTAGIGSGTGASNEETDMSIETRVVRHLQPFDKLRLLRLGISE